MIPCGPQRTGPAFDDALEALKERQHFLAQTLPGIVEPDPPAAAELLFEPVIERGGHAHRVDVDAARDGAVLVFVAAERLACEDTDQAGFFLGLAGSRVAGPFTFVDRSLRHDPALAAQRRDQRDLDAVPANPVRNYGCLP